MGVENYGTKRGLTSSSTCDSFEDSDSVSSSLGRSSPLWLNHTVVFFVFPSRDAIFGLSQRTQHECLLPRRALLDRLLASANSDGDISSSVPVDELGSSPLALSHTIWSHHCLQPSPRFRLVPHARVKEFSSGSLVRVIWLGHYALATNAGHASWLDM